jgi:hypothetical protein
MSKEGYMVNSQTRQGRRIFQKASIGLGIGLIAFAVCVISLTLIAKSADAGYLLQNNPKITLHNVPLSILFLSCAGFLIGLIGVFWGCSCIPDAPGDIHPSLCKWFSWIGISISLFSVIGDFGLMIVLGLIPSMK